MKKAFVFLITLALLIQPLMAFTSYDSCENSYRVFAAPEYAFRRWSYSNGDRETQNLWGAVFGIEHFRPCSIFWRAIGIIQGGRANHVWYDHELSAEGQIGYTFALDRCQAFSITPFAGIGYFYDHETTYEHANVFDENYWYVPLGLLLNWEIDCQWSLAFRGQANLLVARHLKDYSTPMQMTKKTIWRGELPITYRLNTCWDLSLVPFYQYEPNVDCTFPGSEPSEWGKLTALGARLEIGYDF